MKTVKINPNIDTVTYNFKGNISLQIDVVPIAERLLSAVNIARTTAPHRANFHRIIWFQTGEPVHTVDFERIQIKSPALLFVHKDKIHKFDGSAAHDGKVLIFTDDFYLRTESNKNFFRSAKIFNAAEQPLLLSSIDDNLEFLFNSIQQEILAGEPSLKSEVLYHSLNSFLYAAERTAFIQYPRLLNQSPNLALINLFLEAVEKNYKNRLSIEKYAELLSVSVNKLNLAVKETKGKTGKQIVTERLILEAKRLLVHSGLTVKEVGYELGFDEPTNFIKFFKTNVRHTPVEFQEFIKSEQKTDKQYAQEEC